MSLTDKWTGMLYAVHHPSHGCQVPTGNQRPQTLPHGHPQSTAVQPEAESTWAAGGPPWVLGVTAQGVWCLVRGECSEPRWGQQHNSGELRSLGWALAWVDRMGEVSE